MYISNEFPGCCSIRVFTGMDIHEDNDALFNFEEAPRSPYDVYEYLHNRYRKGGMPREGLKHQAFMLATTLDQQYDANHAFQVMGWKHSKWARNNPTRPIRLWFINCPDLLDKLDELEAMNHKERVKLFTRQHKAGEYEYPYDELHYED